MNTEGHEDVAHTAGIPLLRAAFGDDRSLEALYLGNWLTDVSQLVDPVAVASGVRKVEGGADSLAAWWRETVNSVVGQVLATVFERTPEGLLEPITDLLAGPAERAVEDLTKALDTLTVASTPDDDERASPLGRFAREIFLLKGYFKFVHPGPRGARMEFEAFMSVFGRETETRGAGRGRPADDRPGAYTQYYPHEHLDRPEIFRPPPPKGQTFYAPGQQQPGRPFRVEPGRTAGPRATGGGARVDPDLYSYLRDDIEMTAGLLAEVDGEMKAACAAGISATDPAWHRTLAKLGHALHQVEDFFAHSNWTELAHRGLGGAYLAKAIPPTAPIPMMNRAATVYAKRLTRFVNAPATATPPHEDELWVVTGYFDVKDTVISVAHLVEESLGLDAGDPWAEGWELARKVQEARRDPDVVVVAVQKRLRETLDLLTRPEHALDDPLNETAKGFRKEYGKDARRLLRPEVQREVAARVVRETTVLRSAPERIQRSFLSVVIEGTRVLGGISLISGILDIASFVSNPFAWLVGRLPRLLADRVKDALVFYGRERLHDAIAATRIGCHSLLAKDHGTEPFFVPAKQCATSVHWWIVHTMLRWKDDPDAGWVDWLELLEFFLRHPLTGTGPSETRRLPLIVVHTVRPREQLQAPGDPVHSLVDRYRRTALDPATFTWRTIADANFGTAGLPTREAQRVVNRVLRDKAWGVPVTPPNYAFKPGLRVFIPGQRLDVTVAAPSDARPWYREVFDLDWTVFLDREDPKAGMSVPGIRPHRPVIVGEARHQELIDTGRVRRQAARKGYRVAELPA